MSLMEIERNIRVEVETTYLEEQSDPKERRFVFSYTITIRNEGRVPAKLLTRHWVITDANGTAIENGRELDLHEKDETGEYRHNILRLIDNTEHKFDTSRYFV